MRKYLIFGLAAVFLFAPFLVSAESFIDGIVPEEIKGTPQSVQACHLVYLANNIITFSIWLATAIATLMFAYAGFLYVTASANKNNLDQAKKIFTNTLIGFVLILGAYLIINLIVFTFTGSGIGNIKCVQAEQQPLLNGGTDQNPIYTQDFTCENPASSRESLQRSKVTSAGLEINREYSCPDGVTYQEYQVRCGSTTYGCTSLANVRDEVLDYAIDVKRQCDEALGVDCNITITGGSEEGHAGYENTPGSHGAGDKFDLSYTDQLEQYIQSQVAAGNFTVVQDPQFGTAQYIDNETGAVWTNETTHYDICNGSSC